MNSIIKTASLRYVNLDIRHKLYKIMGGEASINYSVPYTQKPEGESAIYRNPFTKDKLYDRPEEGVGTMKAAILNSAIKYANRPALGKIVKKENKSEIESLTYKQALQQAHQLGSGIINEKLYSTPEGQSMRLLAIFSKNRV